MYVKFINNTIKICYSSIGDVMFNLEYLKDEKQYDNLIKDVEVNFPKYKKALYDYYESNNDKFPFEGQSFCDDVLLVIYLFEYEYDKSIVLKVLDSIEVDNAMSKVLILNFLCGFGVIEKNEMDERNPYLDLMRKNTSF